MCELPNDAARYKALDTLPPSLHATYERILRRVNQSNLEVQKLVRRALQLLVHETESDALGIAALCEALAIRTGDRKRDVKAIPDERDVLRWCSSLVRKSTNGYSLELAHFTVQEFLLEIDHSANDEFSAYSIDGKRDSLELAQVCLTYLNFEDFDQEGNFSLAATRFREEQFPFRHHAVNIWPKYACNRLCEVQLLPFLKVLFSPSKSNNFVAWARERVLWWDYILGYHELESRIINSWVAEASPLHFAAFEGLPELCKWLVECGCDVHQTSTFGTPLHCAVLGRATVHSKSESQLEPISYLESTHHVDTVQLLLKAGADPNALYNTPEGSTSPLAIAMRKQAMPLISQLLREGSLLDEDCLECLEDEPNWGYQEVVAVLRQLTIENTPNEYFERLSWLSLTIRDPFSRASVDENLQKCQAEFLQNVSLESRLRFAAEFGQSQAAARSLEDKSLQIDSREEYTGMTALHHAAENDHIQTAKIFMSRGADPSPPDSIGTP